jgi:hypothetical protein
MRRDLADAFGGPQGAADHVPILAMERYIVASFARSALGGGRRSSIV